jgi:hypothetical protein
MAQYVGVAGARTLAHPGRRDSGTRAPPRPARITVPRRSSPLSSEDADGKRKASRFRRSVSVRASAPMVSRSEFPNPGLRQNQRTNTYPRPVPRTYGQRLATYPRKEHVGGAFETMPRQKRNELPAAISRTSTRIAA